MKRSANGLGLALVLLVTALGAGCVPAAGGDDGAAPTSEQTAAKEGALSGALAIGDIMRLARDAGLPCDALVVAGAVGMAESGGYPDAINDNGPTDGCAYGSRDRGIWQINDCYWADISDACAYDPACNAEGMARISSNGSDWQPWAAFNNGLYEKYLGDAEAAYAAGIAGCDGTPGGGSGSGSGSGAECDALGYEGECVGAVSVWAEDGACRVRDCGAEGKACGLISDEVGYGCLGGTEGSTAQSCASLGYIGACMSDTLVWVEDGACRTKHCPSDGKSCVWAGEIGYNCE